MQHRFPTPDPIQLTLTLRAGTIRVHALDTAETVVEVAGSGSADPGEVEVVHDGRALSVTGPDILSGLLRRMPEYTLDITLPTGSSARIRSGSADVVLTGSLADVEVVCGSGAVSLERADAASRLHTGSGGIRVGHAGGELSLRAGSGDVVVDELSAAGHIKAGSGDVVVHTAFRDLTVTTGSGDVRVDAAHSGELHLRAGSGDVSVGVPQGIPVWADAHAAGGVRNRLSSRGAPEKGQDHVRLLARIGSGSLQLRDA